MTPESSVCLPPVRSVSEPGGSSGQLLRLDLTPDQQALTERFATLAREHFAPRAAHYDRTATFPPGGLRRSVRGRA